jgi:hypothetical protein
MDVPSDNYQRLSIEGSLIMNESSESKKWKEREENMKTRGWSREESREKRGEKRREEKREERRKEKRGEKSREEKTYD